ncbi:hypothetical protein JQ628_26405 [Bradyrhizobium lablabi]|uniref:hypothetical protein n=1 Tax=Bradyrhizobium lablabi TaxID=722472 RepID=UPI001BAD67B3|nr:hypothetical protein [Bradyrhizobium lablabi]MBR1125080.1 hypothetical protein [Bradyrhizobium lablabi]
MKKTILASACILALSMGGAFAQSQQPAPGASSSGNVGPGAGSDMNARGHNMKKGTTTGAAPMKKHKGANPSSSGNAGAGTNK